MLKRIFITIILILISAQLAFAETKSNVLVKFVALSDVQLTFRNQDNSRRLFKDSEKLFDENCRICDYSVYHGNKIHPRGELKDYLIQESKERGNLYCTYKGTEESEIVFDTGEIKVVPYDVYHIV